MPDKVRSVDDMVADMERAVEEPEGNTSSGKHRQHVAQAIEKLLSSQIIDGNLRYIEDGTGSKAATKTAPALLNVAAAVQEMVSEMSGRKMSYTITIEGKAAAAQIAKAARAAAAVSEAALIEPLNAIAATFIPKLPLLPPEMVRRVVEYAFHVGDY